MTVTKIANLSDGSGGISSYQGILRNAIINGDMRIDQRDSDTTPVSAGSGNYGPDRFFGYTTDGAFTIERVGGHVLSNQFQYALKATVTSANASRDAADNTYISQVIEGVNSGPLMFGLSSARTVVLSFTAQSSKAGTYSVALSNKDLDRQYIREYTLVADTPTEVALVFPGDITGTWYSDTNPGIRVKWDLGSGTNFQNTADEWAAGDAHSTSNTVFWIGESAGATFYLTGVQLHPGSVALPFDPRPYAEELRLCQRYCFVPESSSVSAAIGFGHAYNSSTSMIHVIPPVQMRAAGISVERTLTDWHISDFTNNYQVSALSMYATWTSANRIILSVSTSDTIIDNQPITLKNDGTADRKIIFSAEL